MRNLVFVILGAGFSALIGYIYMKGYGKIRKIAEGFVKLNPELMRKDDEKEILEMIRKGENEKVEFKSSLRVNLHTKEIDRKVEHSALKTIVAFLNSEGGSLLIGVSNQKEIVGIDEDRFENEDKFTLHLTNLIKEKIGKKYLSLTNITSACIKDKSIIRIDCKKSDRQIFLRPTPQEEEFYIRVGPSNAELKGSELVDYIEKKFRK